MSSLFDYAALQARQAAAAVHAEAGRFCQCGHLMHVGQCRAKLPLPAPGGSHRAFCGCGRALVMGESRSCGICDAPTGVDSNGVSPIVCQQCMNRANDATKRRLAARALRRPAYAVRGWRR